jgi:cytochrome c
MDERLQNQLLQCGIIDYSVESLTSVWNHYPQYGIMDNSVESLEIR